MRRCDMTEHPALPPEIAERFMKCLREVNGTFEVADMRALLNLIIEHGKEYPQLQDLISINEEALVQRFLETGGVPPGVKMVGKTRESDKVTRLDLIHGPRPPSSQK
jgi:hypothetical protein